MPILYYFNAYQKARFFYGTYTGCISPNDFRAGVVNLMVDSSRAFSPYQKEILKAAISMGK